MVVIFCVSADIIKNNDVANIELKNAVHWMVDCSNI